MTDQHVEAGKTPTNALVTYDPKRFNVLMPLDEIQQIAPWHAARITKIQIDIDPRKGDIYKVGSRKNEDGSEEDLFGLSKGPLTLIAQAAGIIFNWDQHGVESEHYDAQGRLMRIRWKTVGMLRMPDGTFRSIPGTKEINIAQDADKLRLDAFNALRDFGTYGKEAERWQNRKTPAGKPVGHWEKVRKKGKGGKDWDADVFFFDDMDSLNQCVEERIQSAIIQRRYNAPALAETGAMLRMIRFALGLKGQMTKEELAKPFVIPRIEFSPDYTDPNVRAAVIQHGLGAMQTLFGQAKQGMALGAGDAPDGHFALPAGPEPRETVGQQAPGRIMDEIDVTAPAGETVADVGMEPQDDDAVPWGPATAEVILPCKGCGEPITDHAYKKGGVQQMMAAAEIAAQSKATVGAELCWDCWLQETRSGGGRQ